MSESFSWPVRVYYEDTDTAGVVYYANYLKFMERARTEWLRSFGYEQDQLIHQEDMIFVVRSVKLDYHRPALFNESLEVTATIKNMGKASIVFEQQVIRKSDQPEMLVSGEVKLACLSHSTMRPRQMPQSILEAIKSVI